MYLYNRHSDSARIEHSMAALHSYSGLLQQLTFLSYTLYFLQSCKEYANMANFIIIIVRIHPV